MIDRLGKCDYEISADFRYKWLVSYNWDNWEWNRMFGSDTPGNGQTSRKNTWCFLRPTQDQAIIVCTKTSRKGFLFYPKSISTMERDRNTPTEKSDRKSCDINSWDLNCDFLTSIMNTRIFECWIYWYFICHFSSMHSSEMHLKWGETFLCLLLHKDRRSPLTWSWIGSWWAGYFILISCAY